MVPRGRLALLESALQSAERLSKSPWITEEGFRDVEDLLDMGRIGRSLMDDIASCVHSTAGYEHWSPADDPAEIVVDLINDLTDTRAALQSAEQRATKLAEEVERLKPFEEAASTWAIACGVARGERDIAEGRLALLERRSGDVVVLPREPTREMWAAMGNALVGSTTVHHDAVAAKVWSALVALAPLQGEEAP
jgi:hypothetical protein